MSRPPDAPVARLERARDAGDAENEPLRERLERAVSSPAPPTLRGIPRAEAARARRVLAGVMAYANAAQLRCFRRPGR
eukprot:11228124-Lingulodinium_polyedra.AAC.1